MVEKNYNTRRKHIQRNVWKVYWINIGMFTYWLTKSQVQRFLFAHTICGFLLQTLYFVYWSKYVLFVQFSLISRGVWNEYWLLHLVFYNLRGKYNFKFTAIMAASLQNQNLLHTLDVFKSRYVLKSLCTIPHHLATRNISFLEFLCVT